MILIPRQCEARIENLRSTQQRVSSQHLSHQWFYEEALKGGPTAGAPSYASAPLAPSRQHILTDLGNAVANVLAVAKVEENFFSMLFRQTGRASGSELMIIFRD